MYKQWRIHRPLARINCVEVGHEGIAFTPGIPVKESWGQASIALQDFQNGFEAPVKVQSECVVEGRVYEAGVLHPKSMQPRIHKWVDTFVRFDALHSRLPFGILVYEPVIPGGVWYRRGDARRSPWLQAGPSYSYSKDQLFLMQEGDRVIFGAPTRVGERIATLVCHKTALVLRHPKEKELEIFWDEQKLWSIDWKDAMGIENPHR